MFACPTKESAPLDWSGPLRTYLSNNYSPGELDKHSASIQRLSTTRERVANASGAASSSVEALESYLRMLNQVEPRFPLGEGGLKLSFTWFDALKPSKKLSMPVLAYERASVLFNLAAVLSHQGVVQDRSDPSGMKKACTFFQRAGGIFAYLKENVVGVSLTGPTLSDLSPEGLEMLSSLMIAQAQACFYEKAVRDKLKPTVLSKLSAHAASLYERALESAVHSSMAGTLDPAWRGNIEFQYLSFSASMQFQYSKVVHAQAEETTVGYGEEIARLALASELCEKAIHVGKSHGLPPMMTDATARLREIIHSTMDEATGNNNKIYMQVVPDKRDLQNPAGSQLAKAIVPSEDLTTAIPILSSKSASSEDHIFVGLLPVAMQEAEALFQSKLQNLVESMGRKVTDSNEAIKLQLAEAGLPAAVEASADGSGLPSQVWDRLNQCAVRRGGVQGLKNGIASNEQLSRKADTVLAEIEAQLDTEEREDQRCRSTWGSQWTATSSAELSMHMRADTRRYRQLVGEARASDQVLTGKLRDSSSRMEILGFSRQRLDGMFPKSEEIDRSPDVERTREALALMLVELGSNVQLLERLQGEIVDAAADASIAGPMSRAPGGAQAVAANQAKVKQIIDAEMVKFEKLASAVDQALPKNPRLLDKVLEKNHMFSAMRNQSEASMRREGVIAEIDAGIACFEEIVMFIQEGEKFYINLTSRIEQLRTTSTDHVMVRDMQRKELEAELASRAGRGSGGSPPAYPGPSGGAGGSYPGMLQRQASQPYMQAFTPAQAFPLDQVAANAYPLPSSAAAPSNQQQSRPPSYQQAAPSAPSGDAKKLQSIKSIVGDSFSDAQISQALDGAGGDVNRAVNHLLSSQDTASSPASKRSSKKLFGVF